MKTKNFNRIVLENSCSEREFYVNEPHVKVHFYNGSLFIVDLTNAMKTGKTCEHYSINWNGNDFYPGKNIVEMFGYDLKVLLRFLRDMPWAKNRWDSWEGINFNFFGDVGYMIYKGEGKSVHTFSPYSIGELKPLKETPAKWTLRHALRALFNGQFEWLRCKGYYTDDYAWDMAMNYRKGGIMDAVAFAADIMEGPSGWWVSGREDNVVNICCHSFDNNEFKFKVA